MHDREYLSHIIECCDDLIEEVTDLEEEVETLKRCVFEEVSEDVTEVTRERIRRCLERADRVICKGACTLLSWGDERKELTHYLTKEGILTKAEYEESEGLHE